MFAVQTREILAFADINAEMLLIKTDRAINSTLSELMILSGKFTGYNEYTNPIQIRILVNITDAEIISH